MRSETFAVGEGARLRRLRKQAFHGGSHFGITTMSHPLTPPFTLKTATQKVRMAEDAWNSRDPERVALAYSTNSRWRNRNQFLVGREEIRAFLREKWAREKDYRLVKELWSYTDRRIAVRFQYEWQGQNDHWYRAYGNENWEFDDDGLMRWRQASINDVPIREEERLFLWDSSMPRPSDDEGLKKSDLYSLGLEP